MIPSNIKDARRVQIKNPHNFQITLNCGTSRKNADTDIPKKIVESEIEETHEDYPSTIRISKKLCVRDDNLSNSSGELEHQSPEGSDFQNRGMLPYYKQLDNSEDGRQNEYIDYVYSSGNCPSLIDSSSSSDSFETYADTVNESEGEYDMNSVENENEPEEQESELDYEEDLTGDLDYEFDSDGAVSDKEEEIQPEHRDTENLQYNHSDNECVLPWQVPYCSNSVRLFLSDIGYIPEPLSKKERSAILNKRVSNPPDTNQDKAFTFKIPALPVKRTITRQVLETVINNIPLQKEDDSISLSASSLGEAFEEFESEETVNNEEMPSSFNSFSNFSTETNNSDLRFKNVSRPPTTVSAFVSNNSNQEQSNGANQEQKQESESAIESRNFYLDYNRVPNVFKGLCFPYYLRGSCNRMSCIKPHTVHKGHYTSKFKNHLDRPSSIEAYHYSKKYPVLFNDVYECFIHTFVHFRIEDKIIEFIPDLVEMQHSIDLRTALNAIVKALEEPPISDSYLEIVEKISLAVPLKEYPTLVDALLDIMSCKPVVKSWHAIKKLIHVNNYIAAKYFSTILSNISLEKPINKALCISVYSEVIENELTEISQLNQQLLNGLRTLVNAEKGLQNEPPRRTVINGSSIEHSDQRRTISPLEERFVRTTSSRSTSSDENRDCYISEWIQQTGVSVYTTARSSETDTNFKLSTNALVPFKVKLRAEATNMKVTLFPTRPVIGEFKYKKSFLFSSPMQHHLLPCSKDVVGVCHTDYVDLNECIQSVNANKFLELLDNHSAQSTVATFVIMCVQEFKNNYLKFMKLIEAIKVTKSDYNSDPTLKGLLEVVAFNLVIFFYKKFAFNQAERLLDVFLDWDSLITSKVLEKYVSLSAMGKYLLLADVLMESKSYHYCFEILRAPGLNFLKSPNDWPLEKDIKVDLVNRNRILKLFFQNAYRYSIASVCELYRSIFSSNGIHNFDARTCFNEMLEDIINKGPLSLLQHISYSIDIFYKKMEPNLLRSYIIIMSQRISEISEKLVLFDYGCQVDIYPKFTGQESLIAIKTNMQDSEIQLILENYFYSLQIIKNEVCHGLTIRIELPSGPLVSSPKMLSDCVRSVADINFSIKRLLKDYFLIENFEDDTLTSIVISAQQLIRATS